MHRNTVSEIVINRPLCVAVQEARMVSEIEINDMLKPMLLKDLRIQCRARGLNPGGGKEALIERLRDVMLATGDL